MSERHIIIDVPVNGTCDPLRQFGLRLDDAREMTDLLMGWDGWHKFNPETILFIFPGNGADIVRSYLPPMWFTRWRWITVKAKRHWIPGEDPVVETERIFPRGMLVGVTDVVLIDDVVSSGTTAKQLRRVNEPWIPGAKWHVAAWMAQRARSVRGFSTCYAMVEVGKRNYKVPINSLSTLLQNVEIAESYARRNFPNPEAFLALLNELW